MKGGARRFGKAERGLLPEGRMAGPMPWVIAIMMFLTVLAAAAGLGLAGAAAATAARSRSRPARPSGVRSTSTSDGIGKSLSIPAAPIQGSSSSSISS